MRLWHKDFIPALPRLQLVAQLRECVLIAKNIYEGKRHIHCLINPLFDYPPAHFSSYCRLVVEEMDRRCYRVRPETIWKLEKYIGYNKKPIIEPKRIFSDWHHEIYLDICFYNLLEKYHCGAIQQDEFQIVLNKYYERKHWNGALDGVPFEYQMEPYNKKEKKI